MLIFIMLGLFVFLSSENVCSDEIEPQKETVNLQLKWFHQFQFAGYYAAKEKGYYDDVGLDVNIIERSPDINVVQQVVSGVAQYGIEDSGILVSYANGEPIKALAAFFQHNPFVFFSKQSSGIVSPYEMIAKRVMFDKKNERGASEAPLRALLAETGISVDQFTHVTPSFNKMDLIEDRVDVMSGYITVAPYFFEEQGVKINIINPLNYGIDFYGDLLFTSEQEIVKHPGRAEKFRQASIKGWQYALEHSHEIIQLILEKYSTKQSLNLLRFEAAQVKKLIVSDTIPLGEIKPSRLRKVADLHTQLELSPELSDKKIEDFVNLHPAALQLSKEETHWLQQHSEFTFSGKRQWLPYEAFNENDQYIGIVSEYLARIAELLGIKFNFVISWDRAETIEKVRQGKIDIISETVDSELSDAMSFTEPYLSSPIIIVMRKEASFVDNIQQIADKKIAMVKNYGYVHNIIKKYPNLNYHWVNDIAEGLNAVSTGKVDALLATLANSSYQISNMGFTDIRIVGKTEFDNEVSFAISKKIEPLIPLFERAIDSMSEIEKTNISAGWGDQKYKEKKDYLDIFKITASLLFLVGIVILWNRRLAKEIVERKKSETSLRQSEQRFRTIFDEAPLGVAMIDSLTGHIYEVNPQFALIAGRTQLEMQAIDWMEIIHADDVQEYLDQKSLMNQGKTNGFSMTKRYIRPDGSVVWINMTIARMLVEEPSNPRHLCMIEDITQRKKMDDKLKIAATVYQQTTQGIIVTDANDLINVVNPAFTELTGYRLDDVLGKRLKFLRSNRHDPEFYAEMWKMIFITGQWQGEIWNRRKNGTEFAAWQTVNSIYDENGKLHQRVVLFSDITEKKLVEEKIWEQANFDSLTKLPNRSMFNDRLAQEIKVSQRTKKSVALFFLDLDHFKEVNDALGHDMGDILLIDAAKRIEHCVREIDTVSRLGGDEFTVIVTELDTPKQVERIAENIIACLNKPFKLAMEQVYVSASIGISIYPDDAITITDLIKNADRAMYLEKKNGRNQFCFFTQAMQVIANNRHQLINDLHLAIKENQFQLHFQPIVNLKTGLIYKAEALLRWLHPERGLISPVEFIPLAEETGVIVEIGNWVFLQAATLVKELQENFDPNFQISINKSPVQFRSETDQTEWLKYIEEFRLKRNSIIFEVTEHLLIEDSESVNKQFKDFRSKGIQFAIDDFGTGFSTFSYLNKFNIDYLKIDQSFVSNVVANSNELALCEAIIVMAHKLGINVIAEGVETEEQKQLLVDAGCDYGQGFIYSKPVEINDFTRLLQLVEQPEV